MQSTDADTTSTIKKESRKNRRRQDEQAQIVHAQLKSELKSCVDLSIKKSSSSWLSIHLFKEHGFYLHKGEFMDTLSLCYVYIDTKQRSSDL